MVKKPPKSVHPIIPPEAIESRIFLIRGHKVMLDRDLAQLYGVKSIVLRQQVKRDIHPFPKTSCCSFLSKKLSCWYHKM